MVPGPKDGRPLPEGANVAYAPDLPADTVRLARYLIGKTFVRVTRGGALVSGRIVETEAYPPGDPSGHAFRGKTASNDSLFLERGLAYVYFTYGSSFMMNVSSERPGIGAGVLILALEPLDSVGLMRRRRGGVSLRDLARGPRPQPAHPRAGIAVQASLNAESESPEAGPVLRLRAGVVGRRTLRPGHGPAKAGHLL